jgi:hypothetical protein
MPAKRKTEGLAKLFPVSEDGAHRMRIETDDNTPVQPTDEIMATFGYVPIEMAKSLAVTGVRFTRMLKQARGYCPMCGRTLERPCSEECELGSFLRKWGDYL